MGRSSASITLVLLGGVAAALSGCSAGDVNPAAVNPQAAEPERMRAAAANPSAGDENTTPTLAVRPTGYQAPHQSGTFYVPSRKYSFWGGPAADPDAPAPARVESARLVVADAARVETAPFVTVRRGFGMSATATVGG